MVKQEYVKGGFIGFRINPEIAEKFNSETKKHGFNKSGLIKRWITDFLNNCEKISIPNIV